MERLDSGAVPSDQIYHVLFHDLVADPVGEAAKMYEHFGIDLTEEGRAAMERFMRENPRDSRPPHRFGAGSDGAVARVHAAFTNYQQRFSVPPE